MIGIIGAMNIEIDGLKEEMKNLQTKVIAGIHFCSGEINNTPCVVAVCGPGKVNAAVCAQIMALEYKPEAIINTGVAGGARKDVKINDVVISTAVVQHDMDLSPLGDPIGKLPELNIIEIPADEKLATALAQEAEKVYTGTVYTGVIATGDQFVSNKDKIHEISNRFNALACEMEGGSIGHVCYMNKVPFVVLRAISDNADDDACVDYPQFAKEAAAHSIRLLTHVLPTLSKICE